MVIDDDLDTSSTDSDEDYIEPQQTGKNNNNSSKKSTKKTNILFIEKALRGFK